jgi:hypothetical protein
MSLVTCAGLPVERGRLTLPRIGIGHGDFVVGASTGIAVGDSVEVAVSGSVMLTGKAMRAGADAGALRVRVVAGAAGMNETAGAKFYKGAAVSLVLADLLDAAGESLSTDTDAAFLAGLLPAWSVLARPVLSELWALVSAVAPALAWRLLPDGTLWIGEESWPETTFAGELAEPQSERARLVYTSEAPTLLPGTTLDGSHIGDVEHSIAADRVVTSAQVVA